MDKYAMWELSFEGMRSKAQRNARPLGGLRLWSYCSPFVDQSTYGNCQKF